MSIRNRFAALAAAGILGGGLVAVAAPAMAANTPCPPSGNGDSGECSVTATAVVNTSSTLSLSTTSITFPAANPGQLVTATKDSTNASLEFTVNSNDGKGYVVNWLAPTNDVFTLSGGTFTFPISGNMELANASNMVYVDAGSNENLDNSAGPSASGGDTAAFDFQLTPPSNAAGGTYTAGPFLIELIAN